MSEKSNAKRTVLFTVSVSFLVAAVEALLLTIYYRGVCFRTLGAFCGELADRCPEAERAVFELLKTGSLHGAAAEENLLTKYGYRPSDFGGGPAVFLLAGLAFFAGAALFLFSFRYQERKLAARVRALTGYLEQINTGGQGLLLDTAEDEFAKLQDEIYKTVTTLCQTREAALAARNRYAENLANIAHQLKTSATSISLSVQMMREESGDGRAAGIERQVDRLVHLEEALLLLSRMDAGTLVLDRKPADVFTLLALAADNLSGISAQEGIPIEVPELGETEISVDLDWTMEAVMNLMKNCMEAAKAATAVHCFWEENPLYVQIRIWDEGEGFEKEDLPYLFERFYRGRKRGGNGIGIGLSLAKEIIEMQDGIIRAYNRPSGGACFEIRFYRH